MSVILIGSLHPRPRNPLLIVLLSFLFLEALIRGWFPVLRHPSQNSLYLVEGDSIEDQ
jgi:hypothetical protein